MKKLKVLIEKGYIVSVNKWGKNVHIAVEDLEGHTQGYVGTSLKESISIAFKDIFGED